MYYNSIWVNEGKLLVGKWCLSHFPKGRCSHKNQLAFERKTIKPLAWALILSSSGHIICNNWNHNNNQIICYCQVIVWLGISESCKLDLIDRALITFCLETDRVVCMLVSVRHHTRHVWNSWLDEFCISNNDIYF